MKDKPPTTQDAEKWLTPDVFRYHGGLYKVMPNLSIKKVRDRSKKNGRTT